MQIDMPLICARANKATKFLEDFFYSYFYF